MGSDATSTDARPTGSRTPDTRGRILQVARRRFLADGYAGTSLSAIGRDVGVSAPALYWHFASKEELLYELLAERINTFLAEVVSDAQDPRDRLTELVRRWVGVQLDEGQDARGYAQLSTMARSSGVLTQHHEQQFRRLQRVGYSRISTTVAEGGASGRFDVLDTRATSFAIISMCEGVTEWARANGPLGSAQIQDIFSGLALRMVTAASG